MSVEVLTANVSGNNNQKLSESKSTKKSMRLTKPSPGLTEMTLTESSFQLHFGSCCVHRVHI